MTELIVVVVLFLVAAGAGCVLAWWLSPACPKCGARGAECMGWADGKEQWACATCLHKWTEDADRGWG